MRSDGEGMICDGERRRRVSGGVGGEAKASEHRLGEARGVK